MESAEKRRLNKLLRKPSASLVKTLGLRQKLSRNAQKQVKYIPVVSEKVTKQDISVDVATLCAEMCGVSDLSQSGANLLQKHLSQIARLLVHEILRVMEQSRRGVPQASDIDLASVLIGLEVSFSFNELLNILRWFSSCVDILALMIHRFSVNVFISLFLDSMSRLKL